MTLAYAIHSIRRRVDGERIVHSPKTVFECPSAEYDSYEALGSVRKPTDEEAALYELTASKAAKKASTRKVADGADEALLKPKHKGGGKFVVVDKDDNVVSGDELFDSKEDAQAWADKKTAGDGGTDGLLG